MIDETGRKVKYYRIEPVYEDPPGYEGFATAAVVTCMVTGEMLDGMGGGGDFISVDTYQALRNNSVPRVIVDAAEYEKLIGNAGFA